MILNKTEWVPLASYNYHGYQYLVQAKMKKNGFIKFRTSMINRPFTAMYNTIGLGSVLDIKKQWEKFTCESEINTPAMPPVKPPKDELPTEE